MTYDSLLVVVLSIPGALVSSHIMMLRRTPPKLTCIAPDCAKD